MFSKQWLILTGVCLFLVAWLLCGRCLDLQKRERQLRSQIAALADRAESARHKAATDVQTLEEQADSGRSEIERWERGLPPEPPVVWLLPQLKEHFRRYGFAEPITRFNPAQGEPELPDYQRLSWRIQLPLDERTSDLRDLLSAVADIEEAQRLVKVTGLAIQPDSLNAHGRTAVITVAALVRK